MRRLAVTAAVMTFFGLAIVGSLYNVPPFVCALRSAVGAVVMFILMKIVVRVFVNIIVDTVVRESSANKNPEDRISESANR